MKKLLRKRSLLLVALLVSLCMPAMAQNSYTFNVASVNVEGVPQILSVKTVNEAALETSGTQVVAQKILMQDWSIVGLCEDYNFHATLASVLGNDYYCINNNQSSGNIVTLTNANNRNDTDGLGVLLRTDLGTANASLSSAQNGRWTANDMQYTGDADYEPEEVSCNGDTWAYRGYRRYAVTLPKVGLVDVYVLHMDAGKDLASGYTTDLSRSVNSAAREAQLADLASVIVANASLNRPAIVMGITNSLYTREDLQTHFIKTINANADLTINDAWVELKRGGKYPTFGAAAEVPGSFYFDNQSGEVVNKIFYINNSKSAYTIKANSYYHDASNFANLKNPPVVVSFTVTDGKAQSVGETVIIKDANDANVTVPKGWLAETSLQTIATPTYSGESLPTSGSVSGRYLMNVGSGLYLNAGATWGTQAAEGSEAMPITINSQGGSTYTLQTLCGYVYRPNGSTTEVYMDADNNNTWTITPVSSGSTQYNIYYTKENKSYALTSTGDAGNPVVLRELNTNDDKQKWIILTSANVVANMANASATNPFDVTPFVLPGADFNHNNGAHSLFTTAWENSVLTFDSHSTSSGSTSAQTAAMLFSYEEYNGTRSWDRQWQDDTNFNELIVTSSSSVNLPAGKYTLSFEGMYRARSYSNFSGSQVKGNTDHDMTITMGLQNSNGSNAASATFMRNSSLGLADATAGHVIGLFRDNDNYKNSCELQFAGNDKLTFKFYKPKFDAGEHRYDIPFSDKVELRRFLIAMDNISIKYLGNDGDNSVKALVSNYLYQTALKVAQLNEAGQAAYDVSEVIERYTSGSLSKDGSVEIAMIDAAYEIALRAHNAKIAEDALEDEENPGDVTGLIVNPSFEQGITGWTAGEGWDCGVKDNGAEGSTYYVSNAHSDVTGETKDKYQIYNGYAGDGASAMGAGAVTQTITGLKNGLYELKAYVTSFGPGEGGVPANGSGNTVYIIGNGYHAGVVAKNKSTFEEATLLFLVEDGTAKIGAVGGVDGYYYPSGAFFKADNFRLRYICDAPHGRVYLAREEAAKVKGTFDAIAKQYAVDGGLDALLSTYENASAGGILGTSDGTAEAAAIYAELTETALQQKTIGSDMTWCISDPSFELGKYTDGGWQRFDGWDVRAAKQDDRTYSTVGVDGAYLFNAWNPTGVDSEGNTSPISSVNYTINNIPNGTYQLTAMVSSDPTNKVYIFGNNTVSEGVTPQAANRMSPITLEFEVTEGTATIGVVGGQSRTYTNDEGKTVVVWDGAAANDLSAGGWYKCDDFHLKLLLLADNDSQDEDQYAWDDVLYLDQDAEYIPVLPRAAGGNTYNYKKVVLDRPVAGGVWNTFVVPFAMDYKKADCALYGWEVKQLTHISLDETGQVVMSFADAPSIVPGVSYMIRKKDLDGNLGVIEHGDGINSVSVNTTFTAAADGSSTHPTVTYEDATGNITLTITGVYTTGYVPKDSYFINNNKFYQAQYDNKNRLRGYRAYITITGPQGEARKLSFRIGEGTGVDAANNDEVTVVGIYNLSGMRLNDMEPGVNILQMSDGTTMKVIIK